LIPFCREAHQATFRRWRLRRVQRQNARSTNIAIYGTIAAIIAATIIAATFTILPAPIGTVTTNLLSKPTSDAITACTQNPWPYVNCVGTEFGGQHVRTSSPVPASGYLRSAFGARLPLMNIVWGEF